jgi:hypothetical protein
MVKKVWLSSLLLGGLVLGLVLFAAPRGKADDDDEDEGRIQQGFRINPVHPLNLRGKNRKLVGLGSYIVNAQGGCNDCHGCPTYTPGHNPYQGGDGQINATNYLAGGVDFGPGPAGEIVSRNITPDATGKPAGLTFPQFRQLIHTGDDPDNPGFKLFVMPWPVYAKMNDHDLRAVYEYLSAIPHAEPGTCFMPGQ